MRVSRWQAHARTMAATGASGDIGAAGAYLSLAPSGGIQPRAPSHPPIRAAASAMSGSGPQ